MSENIQQRKRRAGLKILLIIVSVLMLIGIGVGILLWREATRHDRESMIADYIILAPELEVAEKGKNGFNTVEALPFGTILNLQREGTRQEGKTFNKILSSSTDIEKYKKNDYYIEFTDEYDLREIYYKDKILRIFPQKEVQLLPTHIKKVLLDNPYNDYEEYAFTQDKNRIKSSIVWADFNMDNEKDIAVILEGDHQTNRLYVLCYNKDLNQSYIAYTDYNGGFASIRLFNENALIFMDSENLIKSPNNGLIYESTQKNGFKYAVLYNPKTMQFTQYLQKPLSEIQSSYEDDYEVYHGEDSEYDGVEVVEEA